jgi:isocitrate/isopropylmalate dehydrogenase
MKILVLPGDGIGPEIVASTLDILRAADERLSLKLSFETMEIGRKTLRRFGTTLPADVMERIPQTDGVILGQ